MSSSINLSLTDKLREFIDRNCGDGTLFATPSEFLRDLLREKKERMEAAWPRLKTGPPANHTTAGLRFQAFSKDLIQGENWRRQVLPL